MRSSTAFFAAAAALLSFTAATPLERRYQECRAPQQWHICGDGWSGCCSVSPCKGPGTASSCPDEGTTNPPSPTVSDSSAPTSAKSSEPSTAPTPGPEDVDEGWFEKDTCKEDDSNCNWKPTYYHIKNYDEDFSKNSTLQFFAWQDGGRDNSVKRRDIIAVYKDIPATAKNCSLSWYKPLAGIFYGTYADGSFNISIIDTGDKSFEEAVDGPINWKNTKKFFDTQTRQGSLDLGNWGWSVGHKYLNNNNEIDCSGKKELVVHFALSAEGEGAVIIDQVSKRGQINNGFVQRAGWVLGYL